MFINLKPRGIFRSNFVYLLLIHFNNVQTLVCKSVTTLCHASYWPGRDILVKMLITLNGMLYMDFDQMFHTNP